MKKLTKFSCYLAAIIMILFFLNQTLLVFDFYEATDFRIAMGYILFLSFLPPFYFVIKDLLDKNKQIIKQFDYQKKLKEVIVLQSQNQSFYDGKVREGAMSLTKEVCNSICTDRCSIWLYNKDKTSIICQQLYVKKEDNWYSGTELLKKDFEPYFNHLQVDPIIVANDAESHPATSCFKDSYLQPLEIKSMLDVPIMYDGKVIGVICIESLEKRIWNSLEVNFSQMLSTLYSFAHSIKEGNKQKKQLIEIEKFIDEATLISKADSNGKITYVNKKFTEVSGYSMEEVLGKDHNIVNSGQHNKEFWKEMYKTIIKEKKIWNMIVTNKAKNGTLYYVDTYIKAEFDSDTNELIGFTSIRQDVSELKRKELDFRYRMDAINQSNMVIEFDINGDIKFANNNFCKSMGYELNELVGRHHSIFIENKSTKEYVELWEKLSSGQFVSSEFKRLTKDGKEVWIQATYNPIFDNKGSVISIMKIATDITDKVIQSLEIDKKNTYLEHAAKILRHDMHSGINTYIPRGVSSLERRLTEEDIKNLKIEAPLKMIKEGLKHTQKVYKGVYEFTNLVKKEVVLSKTACNIKLILEDYLSSTSYKSQVILDENLPVLVVNEALFCTSIDNLIRNGLKYNDSATKFVKIYFEAERKQFGLRKSYICVEDNGRGISQEEFEHLSKPYVRKEGQQETGSGLGLNICKSILHEHGFEITAEKLPECGTKLKIKVSI
jgi:PAS domain S-box-containing protein